MSVTVTKVCNKDASAIITPSGSWTGWSGYDNHHPCGTFSGGGYNARFFLYFPLYFSAYTGVVSATLRIRQRPNSSGHCIPAAGTSLEVRVCRMKKDWGQGTDRGENVWSASEDWDWNNRAVNTTVTAYATEGSVYKTFTQVDDGWVSINVTDIVTAWFDHAKGTRTDAPNYGFIVINTNQGTENKSLDFWAIDSGDANKAELEVVFTSNTAPNAPTNLAPTSDAIVNTLTPTLTGTHSDPDSGDLMSHVQILFYADDGTTLIWDSGAITLAGSTFSVGYSGPSLTGNTFYRWKARTKDGEAWGPYSALQRFKANSTPRAPSVGLQESPTSDILTLTPTFNVTHQDNDPGDGLMYAYQIVLTLSDGTAVWDSGLIDLSSAPVSIKSVTYAGPALAWGTPYNWKARTKDSNGAVGPYCTLQSFTTHQTGVPVSLAPTGSVVVGNLTPVFTGARGDADDTLSTAQFEVYLDDGVTTVWTPTASSTGVTSTAFSRTCGVTLSGNTYYKWRARVTGSIGGTSNWSALQRFKTPDTNDPTQTAPLGTGIASLTPAFTGNWTSTQSHIAIRIYEDDGTTLVRDTGILDVANGTSYSWTYTGAPALEWNHKYKWQVAVKNATTGYWYPGGTSTSAPTAYTGLQSFQTDAAGVPTLTGSAINNAWITDSTPTLSGQRAGTDTISYFRIRLYEIGDTPDVDTPKWDSGDVAGGGSTTFSMDYNGPALTPGNSYEWQARYTKASGATGDYSATTAFHLNAAPSAPTNCYPASGNVFNNDLTPSFKGTYSDLDAADWSDYPTKMTLLVKRVSDGATMNTVNLTTGLVAEENTITYDPTGGTALSKGVEYQWQVRYEDSKSAVGTYSEPRTFTIADAPTVTISTPSHGSNLTRTTFDVDWTYADANGLPQTFWRVRVLRNSNQTVVYSTGKVAGTAATTNVPIGYITSNNTDYDIEVTVWNTGDLSGSDTNTCTTVWDAPPALTGFSTYVDEDRSRIKCSWDASTLTSEQFAHYDVWRKLPADDNWTLLTTINSKSVTSYIDYYAGQGVMYDYRVTQFKTVTGGPDLESPDSDVCNTGLESDEWYVVGADRDASHIATLPVVGNPHEMPVQQEVFEPIGSNRKVIGRGYVLGNEGELSLVWASDEATTAKQLLNYLVRNKGPHLLKTPFGEVWEVEFAGPQFDRMPVGHLTCSLSFIEVA